ncbi:MAG: sulfotransferase, partial [Actinomycetota bacterium]|nr:sulfotransferase [Actinomycetota bacterium]
MTTPILVTGSHRSGTTWVGKMLAASGEAGYIHEPFNPRRRPGWTGNRIPYWFQYVTEANEHLYAPVVEDVLAFRYPLRLNASDVRSPRQLALFASDAARSTVYRTRRLRPLLKDPIALFSAEWLADRFDAEVVVMIRHPAGFASSVKRLGWAFRFRSWIAQDALMEGPLNPYRERIVAAWREETDILDQAILMWNAMHHVIEGYRARRPDWRFIRHEDISRTPEAGFADLYTHLGLQWSERAARVVAGHSGAGNPGDVASWRHGSVKRDSSAATRSWT